MKFDPKADVSFQKVLQEIMKGVISFTPTVLEVPKPEEQEPLPIELVEPNLLPPEPAQVELSKEKGVWVSVENFTDLRIRFFWAHCFPEDHEKGEPARAFQSYCAVRDTPEAQKFLKEHPASFERLHHALCEAAVSTRRQKQESAA